MSRIATFVIVESSDTMSAVLETLRAHRERLTVLSKDRQKDGADSEQLVKAFAHVDRVIAAIERSR